MKVLLMGFDPFGGESVNPAWEVVECVVEEGVKGLELAKKQIPTVFDKSIKQATVGMDEFQPDIVVALGQAGGQASINVERLAININDARIPDNEGNQPIDTPVVGGGPSAYFSTLPIKAVVEQVCAAGIPATVSNSAGTFVCNHLMYGILHYIAVKQLPIRAGFIHVPYLPEQAVHRGGPSMNLVDQTKALTIALETIAQNQVELWDVYDQNGQKTGRTVFRGQTLAQGDFHIVVDIWVVNSKGQYLIQRRADHLLLSPGMWATTGGSAIRGEDSKTAALRELKEELGIIADDMTHLGRLKRSDSFKDVWLVEQEIADTDICLQQEEVSSFAWATPEEIRELVKRGLFHDYGDECFSMVFLTSEE